jgi:hypothetical protein
MRAFSPQFSPLLRASAGLALGILLGANSSAETV